MRPPTVSNLRDRFWRMRPMQETVFLTLSELNTLSADFPFSSSYTSELMKLHRVGRGWLVSCEVRVIKDWSDVPPEIHNVVEARKRHRREKDFAAADRNAAWLEAHGVDVLAMDNYFKGALR